MLVVSKGFSQVRRRRFSTILPSGEKAERELSAVEREMVDIKEARFSKLGLYKKETNVGTLMKIFQLAQPGNKNDYAACMYSVNHFYNFGVSMDHHDFSNRWLALAVETSRVDEAVQIVKTYNTWLGTPPKIELINILMGIVKIDQARDLLKSIRENWQIPLNPTSYHIVISRLLQENGSISDAFTIWDDARHMDIVIGERINQALVDKLREAGMQTEAGVVEETAISWLPGGLSEEI